jgi:hypothetical protein
MSYQHTVTFTTEGVTFSSGVAFLLPTPKPSFHIRSPYLYQRLQWLFGDNVELNQYFLDSLPVQLPRRVWIAVLILPTN